MTLYTGLTGRVKSAVRLEEKEPILVALRCTPDNFRAELARNQIQVKELADVIGMNKVMLGNFLAETRPMFPWAIHNIGLGINLMLGRYLFAVDPGVPLQPARRNYRRVVDTYPLRAGKMDSLWADDEPDEQTVKIERPVRRGRPRKNRR
jgi:hypothetical protein